MFLFYVLSFFKKGDTIQGGTLFKGVHYLRKYGNRWSGQLFLSLLFFQNLSPKCIFFSFFINEPIFYNIKCKNAALYVTAQRWSTSNHLIGIFFHSGLLQLIYFCFTLKVNFIKIRYSLNQQCCPRLNCWLKNFNPENLNICPKLLFKAFLLPRFIGIADQFFNFILSLEFLKYHQFSLLIWHCRPVLIIDLTLLTSFRY